MSDTLPPSTTEPTTRLPLEPVSRQTVSAQIREQLLRLITTGELAPGGRVPSERELSDQFAVARTSVREAMQGLVSLGVVERRGNRSFVAEHLPEVDVSGRAHRDLVTELFETRRVLEVPIFALAAARASDDDRAAVAEVASRFEPAMAIDEFRRLDREFHTTIAGACENPLLIELYGKVLDRLFRSSTFDALLSAGSNRHEVEVIVQESVRGHDRIADAFARADAEAMRAASADHLNEVERRMVEELLSS